MLTSDPTPSDRSIRRTWWFVYVAWAVMTVQALAFVIRYAHAGPIIDEWEFIPALTGAEPFWPWLWKLHNEHRFPLPRLIYYPLFKATADFRTGCYVSVAGVAWLSLLMIWTAQRLRGRLHFADAVFPLSLLHIGHWENLEMGYQIVFMMNLVLAGILLRIILLTDRENMMRRALQAGVVNLSLMACGAGGLAYGPFMMIWLLALAWCFRGPEMAPRQRWRIVAIVVLAALVPLYVRLYLQGYHRPGHHADPLVVWGSRTEAAWQALRSGFQALSMAFGPAATGLWPVSVLILTLCGMESAIVLLRVLAAKAKERPRSFGLLLFLGALAFMAYGIGWGRCTWKHEGLDIGDKTMTVASSDGLPPTPFVVQVDDEQMNVTNVAGSTWTIVRGFNGTMSAAHSNEAPVTLLLNQAARSDAPFTATTIDQSGPGTMGFSSRYGWITWPALGAFYFMWLIYGERRVGRWATIAIFASVLAMLPFNVGTGILEGERYKANNDEWEKSVRDGMSDNELIEKYFHNYYPDLKERMEIALPLLRKNRIQYYRPIPPRPRIPSRHPNEKRRAASNGGRRR